MSSIASPRPAVQSADDMIRRLKAEGWLPGPPARLLDWAKKIDQGMCRRAQCPGCKRRGMDYRAFHRQQRYTIVAACPVCGCGQEF